jgi:hypothetical protein
VRAGLIAGLRSLGNPSWPDFPDSLRALAVARAFWSLPNGRGSSCLALETQGPAVGAVRPPVVVESGQELGAGLLSFVRLETLGPAASPLLVVSPAPACEIVDTIVANAVPEKPDAAAIEASWDEALASLNGKRLAPIGYRWDEIVASVSKDQRRVLPLTSSWKDAVSEAPGQALMAKIIGAKEVISVADKTRNVFDQIAISSRRREVGKTPSVRSRAAVRRRPFQRTGSSKAVEERTPGRPEAELAQKVVGESTVSPLYTESMAIRSPPVAVALTMKVKGMFERKSFLTHRASSKTPSRDQQARREGWAIVSAH